LTKAAITAWAALIRAIRSLCWPAAFQKNAYINRLVPALHGFKFRHFGHDGIILHEREIRKDEGLFLSSAVLSGKSVSLKNLPRLLPGFHSPSSRQ